MGSHCHVDRTVVMSSSDLLPFPTHHLALASTLSYPVGRPLAHISTIIELTPDKQFIFSSN
jgi:hypothetical protein